MLYLRPQLAFEELQPSYNLDPLENILMDARRQDMERAVHKSIQLCADARLAMLAGAISEPRLR